MIRNLHNLHVSILIIIIAVYIALVIPGNDILSDNLTPRCAIELFAGAKINS